MEGLIRSGLFYRGLLKGKEIWVGNTLHDEGKLAIYDVNSEGYEQFLNSDNITLLKGMRSKRREK
nr:DUF6157 family protein [Lysinibacillus sp. Bpr_S20]